jgi:P27 family predicted phage terminase small subunit
MGKRGPKPKPTALRVFEGDPGRLLGKRSGEPAPAIGSAVPAPPDWLGEVGQAVWREEAPKIHALRLLTEVDCRLFALYCEAWEDFAAARALIAKEGLIAVSDKGAEYQHPAVGVKNKAIQRIKQIGAEFGIGPASRVGMKLGSSTSAADALTEFKQAQ